MENEFDPDQTFYVNYDKIASEKTLLSVTRLLAVEMTKNPYIVVGDFLKQLSNGDLDTLLEIIDVGEDHQNFSDLMLISEMLATGEGLERGTVDVMHQRINQFLVFVSCEALDRKGLVKVHHKNMSFGEDMANAIVVEKI